MDVLGQTFGYVVELFMHTHKKTSIKLKCTRKTACRYFFVTLIYSSILAYCISVSIRCAASYSTPSYQDKVVSEESLEFPALYICSKEVKKKTNSTAFTKMIVEDGICVIDDTWSFDPSALIGKNSTRCSVGEVKQPPIAKLGRNWSCAVFNLHGNLNATRDKTDLESMHVAFRGTFNRPLTAIIMEKSIKNNRVYEPSFIFSAQTDVYVLMRKIESSVPGFDFIGAQRKGTTESVSYLPTISSSLRFDSSGKRDEFTHLSLSFSSFEVTLLEETVTFSWLDALAAVGGAACAARIFLLILPDTDKEKIDDLNHDEDLDIGVDGGKDESSHIRKSSLQSPLLVRRVNSTNMNSI